MAAGDVAGEVGDEQPHPVRVDVDAEGVAGLGAEPVAAGGAAEPGAGPRRVLGDEAAGDQPAEDALGGRPGQLDPAGQLRQGGLAAVSQRAQGRGRVEAAEHRGVAPVERVLRHGTP